MGFGEDGLLSEQPSALDDPPARYSDSAVPANLSPNLNAHTS